MLNIKKSYTFDDVLLIPKYSDVISRDNVDLSVDIKKGVKINFPLIPANMSSITEYAMACTIAELKGLAILHRFSYGFGDSQVKTFKAVKERLNNLRFSDPITVGGSIGVQEKDKQLLDELVDVGCQIICIDVAHAFSKLTGEMTSYVAKKYPNILLIAGNVATLDGANFLSGNGADVVKIGVGPGSLCSTRIMTGCGVPQLSALEEIYSYSFQDGFRRFKIISDGGCKNSGDLVKSLCFSDLVMSGNLFAGTSCAPGEIIEKDGKEYKKYEGSSTHKNSYIEGVKRHVPYQGSTKEVIESLLQGVRSGLSYQGCHTLEELKKDPQFTLITNSGLVESHPQC